MLGLKGGPPHPALNYFLKRFVLIVIYMHTCMPMSAGEYVMYVQVPMQIRKGPRIARAGAKVP